MNGNMDKDRRKQGLILLLILLLVAGVSIWNGSRKEGFHVDEMYSYGLANSNYLPFPKEGDNGAYSIDDFMQEYGAGDNLIELLQNLWKDLGILKAADFQIYNTPIYQKYKEAQATNNQQWIETTWLSGEYYQNYLAVEEGTGFNLASVYYNQRADVHPPFYYIVLHIVCSLFEGSFSKWFGFGVNFVALMAALLVLYRMIRSYIEDSWISYVVILIYGLSMGFQSNMVFFRMYGIVTLLTIALCYFHLHLQSCNWKLERRQKLTLIALVVLGYYTLYYLVVYAAFIAFIALIRMIQDGQAKRVWTYIRQYIYAALIGIAIWPFSLKHFFSDYRGDDFREVMSSIEQYGDLTAAMFGELSKTCMGNQPVVLLGLLVMGLVGLVFACLKRKNNIGTYMIVFIPPILYFLFTAISTPMVHNRYVMNIMPFVFLAVILGIAFMIGLIVKKHNARVTVIAIMFAGVLLLSNCFLHQPQHLTDDGQLVVEVPENTVCVYVIPEASWQAYAKDSYILSQCKKSVILRRSNMDFLRSYEYEEGESVLIYLSNPVEERDATFAEVKKVMGIEHLEEVNSGLDGYYYKRYLLQ